MDDGVFIGGGGPDYGTGQYLKLGLANRHGLIAGATGTGKTVTLQILAEAFSRAGVPVVLSDVKGDLSGLAKPGSPDHKLHDAFMKRARTIGLDLDYWQPPVTFWDIYGEKGHPIRTTIAEMGPLLLSRLLDCSEAQEGVLNVAFRVADEQGWPLLDLADLRAMLVWMGENARDLTLTYGGISTASIGAIQRDLLVLENQGGDRLFGEPALDLADMMRCDDRGLGQVNVLAADQLMNAPQLYATFLLWLLSELFEELPEVGNPDKPKLVFFFDEAHLLFDDAPKALVEKVQQVARLIRSKGVGVYFVTQNPADIDEEVLSQLGNRIQHALRAFTAKDEKELQRAADTYRPNPDFDTAEAIRAVGTGEAVTSMLDKGGVPGIVQRTLIRPPSSQLGPITQAERQSVMQASDLAAKYTATVNRESAAEMLRARADKAAEAAAQTEEKEESDLKLREFNTGRRYSPRQMPQSSAKSPSILDSEFSKKMGKMVMRELTGTTGRRIVRGVLGGLFKGR